jgi:molecular chaperone Hsp33
MSEAKGHATGIGARIAWDDTILPFQLDATGSPGAEGIRGRVARLDGVLERVLAQHAYPPAVEALVAEAALLAALIGPTVKLRWKLSIQVRGDGPARIVAADYYAPEAEGSPARLRAWASFDEGRLDPEGPAFPQIGHGYFAILIDQGEGTTPYQGITPIAGGSLASCAETYFAQSEQLPTRFALSFGRSRLAGVGEAWRAGGVMMQHMPSAGMGAAADAASGGGQGGGSGEGGLLAHADLLDGEEGENWSRANILLDTVEPLELVGPQVQPTDLLLRLFHEERPRVFDSLPLSFGCSCSADKVRQSLSIYSAKDIRSMTTPEGVVTADCQFCGAHYEFAPETLGFEAEGGPQRGERQAGGRQAGARG